MIKQRQHTQASKRARRYRERIRTNRDMNSQTVENVDIPNSQNSSEFIGNNLNFLNRRSGSRLRQTSGERSIIAKRQRTQTAGRTRRYRERIRSNRDVNSQSVKMWIFPILKIHLNLVEMIQIYYYRSRSRLRLEYSRK